jgi:hypothetical protein
MSNVLHQFVRVDFSRFKAFRGFSLHLRHFNILVGPNNSGKSTILAAFRILAAGLRKANTRRAEIIRGPNGRTPGYFVDLRPISVAAENIFYNYDDNEVTTIRFTLSNNNELLLYFPGVSVTATGIIDAMQVGEIPDEIRNLLTELSNFAMAKVD